MGGEILSDSLFCHGLYHYHPDTRQTCGRDEDFMSDENIKKQVMKTPNELPKQEFPNRNSDEDLSISGVEMLPPNNQGWDSFQVYQDLYVTARGLKLRVFC